MRESNLKAENKIKINQAVRAVVLNRLVMRFLRELNETT